MGGNYISVYINWLFIHKIFGIKLNTSTWCLVVYPGKNTVVSNIQYVFTCCTFVPVAQRLTCCAIYYSFTSVTSIAVFWFRLAKEIFLLHTECIIHLIETIYKLRISFQNVFKLYKGIIQVASSLCIPIEYKYANAFKNERFYIRTRKVF